jgi:hypothetical protein
MRVLFMVTAIWWSRDPGSLAAASEGGPPSAEVAAAFDMPQRPDKIWGADAMSASVFIAAAPLRCYAGRQGPDAHSGS